MGRRGRSGNIYTLVIHKQTSEANDFGSLLFPYNHRMSSNNFIVGDRVKIFLDSKYWQSEGWFDGTVICIDLYSVAYFLAFAGSAGLVINGMHQHLYIGRILPFCQRYAKVYFAGATTRNPDHQ